MTNTMEKEREREIEIDSCVNDLVSKCSISQGNRKKKNRKNRILIRPEDIQRMIDQLFASTSTTTTTTTTTTVTNKETLPTFSSWYGNAPKEAQWTTHWVWQGWFREEGYWFFLFSPRKHICWHPKESLSRKRSPFHHETGFFPLFYDVVMRMIVVISRGEEHVDFVPCLLLYLLHKSDNNIQQKEELKRGLAVLNQVWKGNSSSFQVFSRLTLELFEEHQLVGNPNSKIHPYLYLKVADQLFPPLVLSPSDQSKKKEKEEDHEDDNNNNKNE